MTFFCGGCISITTKQAHFSHITQNAAPKCSSCKQASQDKKACSEGKDTYCRQLVVYNTNPTVGAEQANNRRQLPQIAGTHQHMSTAHASKQHVADHTGCQESKPCFFWGIFNNMYMCHRHAHLETHLHAREYSSS